MGIVQFPAGGLQRPATTFPLNPVGGDLFYETDTDKLWSWNGSAWVLQVASGAWDTFTVSISGTGWALGNAVTAGRWTRMGRTIHFDAHITWGSTSTFGTGSLDVNLPVVKEGGSINNRLGTATLRQNGGAGFAGRWSVGGASTVARLSWHRVSAPHVIFDNVTNVNPFTWVAGDIVYWAGFYEAATS